MKLIKPHYYNSCINVNSGDYKSNWYLLLQVWAANHGKDASHIK